MPTQTPLRPKVPESVGGRNVLSTRRGTIMVAALAGLAALALLLIFLANYRDSVGSGDTISVLVAERQLDQGTSGDVIAEHELYELRDIPESEEADGAFTDPRSLKDQVAATTIYPGQQLVSSDFTSDADPVAGKLEGTDRGIAVPLDNAHGNISQIDVGSKVDVLGGFSADVSSGSTQLTTGILAKDVLVLAVNEETGGGVGGEGGNEVVLRVADEQAQRIAFMSDHGDVWLVVRPPTLAKDSSGG